MRQALPGNIKIAAVVAFFAIVVFAIALRNSVGWYGHPVGGMFVDPDGVVSSIGLPTWSGIRAGLRFPDRVIAVEGVPLDRVGAAYRAEPFDRALEEATRSGKHVLRASVQTPDGEREVDLEIEPLSATAWWTYSGSFLFSGLLYAAAAVLALRMALNSQVARSFAKLAVTGFTLLVTTFDFQTSRALIPLLLFSFATLPVTLVILPLRLPDDIGLIRRYPAIVYVFEALGVVLGIAAVMVHWGGAATTSFQILFSRSFGFALVFFGGTFAVRFVLAKDRRRQILKMFCLTTLLPYTLMGLSIALGVKGPLRSTVDLFTLPLLALTPLAMVLAFVRHDAWSSKALLSRITARKLIGIVACIVAIAIGAMLAMAATQVPFVGALTASTAGGILATVFVSFALSRSDKTFFPSLAEYKPTVGQLSEELTSIGSLDDVARAVERTVRRWLPCDVIELVLTTSDGVEDAASNEAADPDSGERLKSRSRRIAARRSGYQLQRVPVRDEIEPSAPEGAPPFLPRSAHDLVVPVVFQTKQLGQLRVGQKRGGALFTSEDMDLLQTIANQGALALAHAVAYAELERRRLSQVAAWRDEREALVETVAAEIAHEVRYPINFFRSIFQRGSDGEKLDAEDIEIGCEEVDRLERLVAGLRRMASPHLEARPVRVAELCARAEVLLRDSLGSRHLEIDADPLAEINCDVDKVTQIVVNLTANALDAAGSTGRVGVSWSMKENSGQLAVWDDGPGFEGDPARLFAPWYTTKPRGTGLGLAITYRLVRAHAWDIEARRNGDRTVFILTISASDVTCVGADQRGVA